MKASDDREFPVVSKKNSSASVSIDAILEALCDLDGGPGHPPGGKACRLRSTERAIAA